ncbi:hypothetical protein PGUG_03176 [Meyerozyma guilliermondii ATCC 6260]|uniref:BHLH domain-containing protein n=1 Tax=Meyerozyma guilliermondii (strain ATCC 6260 / CBS 566 / DSM 6381 / JCM 1539 / NBRC 10279 / NRRL Y-324) TaxID=294746 RepID=A5DIS5_PICGU|nr:uncharacterized protein PGUG_03176 [Meyerozyma guilliermondii ATCC 6260]EDK39078.2 hypothetical protein PGUG_03176 [Meyerozyma guilliermondii ATCC 6260]
MSKREADSIGHESEKKLKTDKKDDIAIDSELLGQQTSYGSPEGNQESSEASAAAAAAAAAVAAQPASAAAAAALTSQQHQQQQHHQQQQLQQQLAYQNAFRQSQGGSHSPSSGMSSIQPTTLPPSSSKPSHGSEEWHKQRRENHKEVERRRRESINLWIKELANLIPTTDTNKSQILQRAVEYIKRLKENESNNIEKWTLEKLLTDQAVSELSASNEKLKAELQKAYREAEHWRRIAEDKEK